MRLLLESDPVAVPSIFAYEVANTLRRHVFAGLMGAAFAERAYGDLVSMPVREFPFRVLSTRAWELRSNFAILDASYVALAERLDATLITLDARLSRGPGIRCAVRVLER